MTHRNTHSQNHIHTLIHLYIQTHTHTYKHTHKHTHKHTDSLTHTNTVTPTYTRFWKLPVRPSYMLGSQFPGAALWVPTMRVTGMLVGPQPSQGAISEHTCVAGGACVWLRGPHVCGRAGDGPAGVRLECTWRSATVDLGALGAAPHCLPPYMPYQKPH